MGQLFFDVPSVLDSMKRRGKRVVVAIAAMAAVAVPADASEIVKCVAKDGLTTYQNFPCDQNAGWLPSSVPAGKAPPPQSAVARADKAGGPASGQAATTLRPGMRADEVRALLGEPQEIVEDEPRSGRVSIWRYADGRLVQFDVKHRVLPSAP